MYKKLGTINIPQTIKDCPMLYYTKIAKKMVHKSGFNLFVPLSKDISQPMKISP